MSKIYLFCIGGTGSRVLRSLTMFMAAGVSVGFDEIVPIVIDPDASNGNLSRANMLLNKYNAIRSNLTFSDGNPSAFFRTEISKIIPNFTLKIKDTEDKTFRQFIDLASMDKETEALMRMLFSDKNLNSSMEDGFKGNPNIGSVVLNQIVGSEDFDSFANNFQQGDKIFIISSIFGGTGASGFPLLLKTLRTGNTFANHALINNAEIGAITILPYFKLKKDDQSEIDSSTFISKTKSALAYYENNISRNNSIDALYFLADTITNTYENYQGGSAQENAAHLIEFLAATAIVDFSNNAHPNPVNKELGIKDKSTVVTFDSFYDDLRSLLFVPFTQFILLANCLKFKFDFYSSKSFNANNEHFNMIYNSQFISELKAFSNEYVAWLKELKCNRRSLDLFDVELGKNKPFDVVTGIKPRKIISLKSDYDLITARLNSAVKNNCISKNEFDKFMEMFYIGTRKLVTEKFNA